MPLSETLSGFFEDEYHRFMKGLDGLTRPERDQTRKATRRELRDATSPRVIPIPAWDDVLHIRPRLDITEAQRNEYYTARRQNRATNLPPEVAREVERRRARYEAIRRSPQPNFDRAWGSVMTALDNVQDFLASLSVSGRISLTLGPALYRQLPEVLTAATETGVEAARRFAVQGLLHVPVGPRAILWRAGQTALRFIPGLGALVLAADVLTLAMILGQLAFAQWLALCAGPREALRAGVGTGLTKLAFKGSTALLARASARSLRWTAARRLSAGQIAGAIGAALVIGQTTDQLYGYGLSLGPIVGGTMGAAYAADARARGLPVELRPSPSVEHFAPRVRQRLRALPDGALLERITAADVWAQAALVLDANSPATDDERLLTVAALIAAVGVLHRDWKDTGWQADIPQLAGWEPPPPTRAIGSPAWRDFVEPGVNLPPPEWPKTWGGARYLAPQATEHVARGVGAGLDKLLASRLDAHEIPFVGAAVTDTTEALWLLLEGDPNAIRAHFEPGWLAAERMAALGFLPHPGTPPEQLQPFWDEVIDRTSNSRNALKTLDSWTKLADEHHIDYILVRGIPPETLEPVTSEPEA